MFFFQNSCHILTMYSPVMCWQQTFPVTEGYLGSKSNFHASSVIHNFENHHSSRNRATILFLRSTFGRVYFHQIFLLSANSSEALIQRCSLMKYEISIGRFSFRIGVLNIFGKSLGKHQRQSSYSA